MCTREALHGRVGTAEPLRPLLSELRDAPILAEGSYSGGYEFFYEVPGGQILRASGEGFKSRPLRHLQLHVGGAVLFHLFTF